MRMPQIRIMSVDDSPAARESLQLTFNSSNGYQWLDSLPQADDLCRTVQNYESPCDLVILDIEMPGKSVCQAATELIDSCQHTRVIFFSGSNADEEFQRAAEFTRNAPPGVSLGLVSKHDGIEALLTATEQAFDTCRMA
jgi:CheY-like chemotaxis protein